MMLANNGKGYDIIIVNGTKVNQYVKRDWISPITKKQVQNIKYIYKKWQTAFPSASGYTVPYFWGTMGIAYRSDLVKAPILSWKQLFKPADDMKGKILMVRSARELIGLTLKANGHSINSTNENEIEEALTLLEKQKPFIKGYGYLATSEKSSILNGSVVAAITYNGDALVLQEFNDKVVFNVPEEGTNLWVDYLAISKHSQNKLLAYKFINFINEPKNAAQMAQYLNYPSPNRAAEKYLPESYKNNKIIYPAKKTLARSEIIKPLPARIMNKYNTVYSYIVGQEK